MSQQLLHGSPPRDMLRAAILRSPSPLRPTAAKTPDRVKLSPTNVSFCEQGTLSAKSLADQLAQVGSELKEQKALHRQALEAHRSLTSAFKAGEEKRHAAEHRAMVAEYELSRSRVVDPSRTAADAQLVSAEVAQQSDEAKLAKSDMDALWKAIADAADESVLVQLRKLDADRRAAAAAELDRQCHTALWEALGESVDAQTFTSIARDIQGASGIQTTLPVAVSSVRRLFEAESSLACEGTPSGKGRPRLSSGGIPRLSPAGTPACVPTAAHSVKRLSLSGATCATPGRTRRDSTSSNPGQPDSSKPVADMTPARSTFPGGVIVATPASSGVKDRIRALESSGRKP